MFGASIKLNDDDDKIISIVNTSNVYCMLLLDRYNLSIGADSFSNHITRLHHCASYYIEICDRIQRRWNRRYKPGNNSLKAHFSWTFFLTKTLIFLRNNSSSFRAKLSNSSRNKDSNILFPEIMAWISMRNELGSPLLLNIKQS